jgi:hypothetical protein
MMVDFQNPSNKDKYLQIKLDNTLSISGRAQEKNFLSEFFCKMEKEIFERGGMEFRKRRVDLDQKAVIARLEERGFSVLNLSAVGWGCPDLLVGKNGQNFLLEIKSENGTLTPAQIEFHKNWLGHCEIIKLGSLKDFLNHAT